MQITFMIRLMVSLINELKSKGFEICRTDVTEKRIEVLSFQNEKSEYNVAISIENGKQGEYLKLTGSVKENWLATVDDDRMFWPSSCCHEEFQIEPLLKKLRCGDRINIERTEDGKLSFSIKITKSLDSKFSMENIDKDATRSIALDILGSIIN